MTTRESPVQEGDLVAGKYRVGRTLGQGGMGVVVAAAHLQLEQTVALKFLLPSLAKNLETVARFGREARAAAKLQSQHVVRVIDVGELSPGEPFMVMEYLDGEDLSAVLTRRGPLPISEAVDYLLQASEAVAEAHALGIIHRDLKPANMFLAKAPGGRGLVKVLDFGISKAPDSTATRLTRVSATFGSPPYMSPEQLKSAGAVDERTDIWALGSILYELLTARAPFESESVSSLMAAVLYADPRPPRSHRPEIPPRLETAVMRCLEKDPRSRFSNVAELATAIAWCGPVGAGQCVERIANILGIGILPAATPASSHDELARPRPAPLPATQPAAPSLPPPRAAVSSSPAQAKGGKAPWRDAPRFVVAILLLLVGGSGLAAWMAGIGPRAAAVRTPGAEPSGARSGLLPPPGTITGGGGSSNDVRTGSIPSGGAKAGEQARGAPTSRARRLAAPGSRTPASYPSNFASLASLARSAESAVAVAEAKRSFGRDGGAPTQSTACPTLLERQGLGEELSPQEQRIFLEHCHAERAR